MDDGKTWIVVKWDFIPETDAVIRCAYGPFVGGVCGCGLDHGHDQAMFYQERKEAEDPSPHVSYNVIELVKP